jgi:hypothetical protein
MTGVAGRRCRTPHRAWPGAAGGSQWCRQQGRYARACSGSPMISPAIVPDSCRRIDTAPNFAVTHDAGPRLARIAAPKLVVHGIEEPMVPPDNGRPLAPRFRAPSYACWRMRRTSRSRTNPRPTTTFCSSWPLIAATRSAPAALERRSATRRAPASECLEKRVTSAAAPATRRPSPCCARIRERPGTLPLAMSASGVPEAGWRRLPAHDRGAGSELES